jgi:hypothetical protein
MYWNHRVAVAGTHLCSLVEHVTLEAVEQELMADVGLETPSSIMKEP